MPDLTRVELLRRKRVGAQLARFAEYVQRCVSADTLTIEPNDVDGSVTVRASWPGGELERVYPLTDLWEACRIRRRIVGDILVARGVCPCR